LGVASPMGGGRTGGCVSWLVSWLVAWLVSTRVRVGVGVAAGGRRVGGAVGSTVGLGVEVGSGVGLDGDTVIRSTVAVGSTVDNGDAQALVNTSVMRPARISRRRKHPERSGANRVLRLRPANPRGSSLRLPALFREVKRRLSCRRGSRCDTVRRGIRVYLRSSVSHLLRLALQENRHRPVVVNLHQHHRAEHAGLGWHALGAQITRELLNQRFG